MDVRTDWKWRCSQKLTGVTTRADVRKWICLLPSRTVKMQSKRITLYIDLDTIFLACRDPERAAYNATDPSWAM
jgi:hypothetical protein